MYPLAIPPKAIWVVIVKSPILFSLSIASSPEAAPVVNLNFLLR